MKFFCNESTDPFYNLALEEYVTLTAEEEVFLLWRNEPTVVVGRHQSIPDELDEAAARAAGVHIVRRMSGGGAVYHDLGNVNFSFISKKKDCFGNFMAFVGPVIDFLTGLGVNAQHIGKNDIGIDGRKISGNAQYICKDNILHHGTLLFDTDLSVLGKLLTPDPEKLQSKGIASVRARVCNISEYLRIDRESFWTLINAHFSNLEPYTNLDFDEIKRLRDEKYATDAWNYNSPNW